MGVGEFGLESGKAPRGVVPKIESQWKIAPGTPVLESTAAKMNDNWSVRPGEGSPFTMGDKGMVQGTQGGAVQYFVPKEDGAGAAQ